MNDFFSWGKGLIESFGFLGLLIINFIGSATIFFPLPLALLVFVAGAISNPWLVGLFSAIGATFGELTSYLIGRGGGKILEKKWQKYLRFGKSLFQRGLGFFCLFLFAATPLPYDLAGILAGIFNFDLKLLLLSTFLGKFVSNSILAWAGFYGIDWILKIFKVSL